MDTTFDTTSLKLKKEYPNAEDFLPLNGTDYVELYVGNAKQAAHFYKTAFGFQSVAYAGLETGMKDRVSYVIQQDKIRLVLTSPLTKDGPINDHINKHGREISADAPDQQQYPSPTVHLGTAVEAPTEQIWGWLGHL